MKNQKKNHQKKLQNPLRKNKKAKKKIPKKFKKPQTKTQTVPQLKSNSGCTELFVRNLAWSTDDISLEQFFSKYGTILSKKILTDRTTGKPRGLGFVEFSTREEAQAALDDADNLTIDGRLAQVTFSDEKPERTGPQGNKQNGNGGYQKSSYQGEKHTIFVGNLSFKSNENSLKNSSPVAAMLLIAELQKTKKEK